ncbi:MAG: hypothetical protein JHC85_14565, partial [Chthoniobacterales bacterium]|nr:hypothetical protein [Chthoniobacterales bacterium]
ATSSILPNNTLIDALITGGTLNKTGFGTLTLTNSLNSFTGPVQIDGAGFIRVENGGQLGLSTAGNAIMLGNAGGVFEVRSDNPGTSFSSKNFSQYQSSTLFASRALNGSGLNQTLVLGNYNPTGQGQVLTFNSRDGYGISIGTGGTITIPTGGNSSFSSTANGLLTFNSTLQSTEGFPRAIFLTATGDILVTGNLNGNSGFAHTAQKGGSGQLTIAGTAGTMTGGFNAFGGTTVVNNFGAFNNGNGGALNLGTTTTPGAVLYLGPGEVAAKALVLSGTTASGMLFASGSGALVLSRGIAATGAGLKNLFLGGTSTAANEIRGVLQDN